MQPETARAPEPADSPRSVGPPAPAPRRSQVALHVAALAALALTHPLLEVIGSQPEFLVAHEVSPLGAVALLVALAGLLPAAAGGAAAALTRRGHGAAGAMIGLLVTVLLLRCARLLGLSGWSVPLACYLGVVAGLAYARAAWARSVAAAAVPALVLVPALFVASPARVVFFPPPPAPKHEPPSTPLDPSRPSVAVVVLDEVNLASLLGPDGGFDADRFPSLAAFAQQSTWYRNATASADMTVFCMRALHSGRRGRGGPEPANTLFELLRSGYAVRAHEQAPVAQACPPDLRLPPPAEARSAADRALVLAADLAVLLGHAVLPKRLAATLLPGLPAQWHDFAGLRRGERRELSDRFFRASAFIRGLPVETGPTLYYLHMLLPHRPWEHLPSGLRYTATVRDRTGTQAARTGPYVQWSTDERWVADRARLYLLQLGAADTLIGELFTQLERVGRWDETLIVVMGDHGITFTPGSRTRDASGPHMAEVAPIPLLIKLPGQREPRVSDRNAETIDVLPTISDALDLAIPWEVDGASLLDEAAPERPTKRLVRRADELELPSSLVSEVLALRDAWARLVGEGPLDALPLFGPYAEALAGRRREELEVIDTGRFTLTLRNAAEYERVDPASGLLPALALGRIDPTARELTLAVLINGVVVAFARTLPDEPGEFEALLPERALRPGRNALEVLVVSGPPDAPRLERARPAPTAPEPRR